MTWDPFNERTICKAQGCTRHRTKPFNWCRIHHPKHCVDRSHKGTPEERECWNLGSYHLEGTGWLCWRHLEERGLEVRRVKVVGRRKRDRQDLREVKP